MSEYHIAEQIREKSVESGFISCGIVRAKFLSEEEEHLKSWLSQGMQGTMDYMTRNVEKRLDPCLLVENAKTVIIVLQNYFTNASQTDPEAPIISKYAYGIDYHFVMKSKLNRFLAFIQDELPGCSGRVFVDSAPVLERAWARRAGLGWIGKNSTLISPGHGSFVFIGEIIIDREIDGDKPGEVTDHCGTCTRCLDACPTQAIIAPRVIDARKCISYQTIEHRAGPDENLRGSFRDRVFGCDICQEVCPWNGKAIPHREPAFNPSHALMNLTSEEWRKMDRPIYDKLFQNSAVKRVGFEKLKRNIGFLNKQ